MYICIAMIAIDSYTYATAIIYCYAEDDLLLLVVWLG